MISKTFDLLNPASLTSVYYGLENSRQKESLYEACKLVIAAHESKGRSFGSEITVGTGSQVLIGNANIQCRG